MKKILIILSLCLSLFAKNSKTTENIEDIGDILRYVIPAYALGYTVYKDDFKEGPKQLTLSIITAQAISETLKVVVGRKRPNYDESGSKKSFPSGHATGVFSAAAFLHRRYSFQEAIVPYALATFTAYSRVRAKKHYWTDVTAGAILAMTVNYFLVDKKLSVETDGKTAMLMYRSKF